MLQNDSAGGADAPENAEGEPELEAPIDVAELIPDFADWLPESAKPYWEVVAAYPIFAAIAIALIFFALAYVVRAVVLRSFRRLSSRTTTELDDHIVRLFSKPLFNTVFLVGLTLATRAAELPPGLSAFVIDVLLSIIVFNWLTASFPFFRLLLDALSRNKRFNVIESRTVPLFDLIVKLALALIGSYILLMIWGINPVGWLASAGIVGIAVGFAAKDTLANLFSGFFILADSPYKIGDYINLDTGDRGKVTHVGMRSTRIITRDDVEITVPNAVIANAKIINESGGPWTKMRLRVKVGVAYGSDVDQVCEVLEKVATDHPKVCKEPSPRVRMRGFGDSSLDFELLCWIDEPELRGLLYHELYMDVYKALNAAEIEIPFPQRDLWVRGKPEIVTASE